MNQSFIPDVDFFKERSFETCGTQFKIKSERVFGRLFGDSEHIPLKFIIKVKDNEQTFFKDKMDNTSEQIIITYICNESNWAISVYL